MASSSDSDDVPLSKRVGVKPRAPTPAAAPAPRKPAAGKRARSGGPSRDAKPADARAARLASGTSFALEEASGDFSAEYATVGVLGRGSFTEVNLLRHRGSGALFALKTCCKLDALSYAHLRAEAAAMRGANHPLLVAPIAVSSPPGRAASYALLMPLCPGGDLLQLLRRQPGNRLPPGEARLYCAMVTLGLQALHDHGCALASCGRGFARTRDERPR